jgi:hypothetical protein
VGRKRVLGVKEICGCRDGVVSGSVGKIATGVKYVVEGSAGDL